MGIYEVIDEMEKDIIACIKYTMVYLLIQRDVYGMELKSACIQCLECPGTCLCCMRCFILLNSLCC